ncbi:MAG: antitoxin family protein [Planctomycetia bacterium]|nr:antitoxin family protein [Planctomycetia bacterium]
MKQTFDAIYENGLLRPLEPLNLTDHERVSVTVESSGEGQWLDVEAIDWASKEGDATISVEEVRSRLAKLGSSLSESVIVERAL